MELVSSFIPVDIGKMRYLFFLVTWNAFVTPLTEQLQKQREAFGEALGPEGVIIQAFRSATGNTFAEVVAKKWPPDVAKKMKGEQDPFMIIINESFEKFDPDTNPWGVVWFSNFLERPDSIYRVLGALAQKVRNQENVFECLSKLSRKQKYKRLSKYVEIQPGLWGVTIDVKALIDDL